MKKFLKKFLVFVGAITIAIGACTLLTEKVYAGDYQDELYLKKYVLADLN